jgi:hypothetical protein
MGLPPVTFALFLITNFGKTWVSRRNIWDTSATPSGIKREWYVCIHSVGRPQARWSDDLRRTAGGSWMRVAEDRARWWELGEAYVQQWSVMGWWWWWWWSCGIIMSKSIFYHTLKLNHIFTKLKLNFLVRLWPWKINFYVGNCRQRLQSRGSRISWLLTW